MSIVPALEAATKALDRRIWYGLDANPSAPPRIARPILTVLLSTTALRASLTSIEGADLREGHPVVPLRLKPIALPPRPADVPVDAWCIAAVRAIVAGGMPPDRFVFDETNGWGWFINRIPQE